MFTEPMEDADDERRVWLDEDERKRLIDHPDDQVRRVAYALAGYCGLRSVEVLRVSPADLFRHDDAGNWYIEVDEAKKDDASIRQTPVPSDVAGMIQMAGSFADDETQPVVDRATSTLRRWIRQDRADLADATDDDRWHYVSFHDLRRTWAGLLANADVETSVAMLWGGWTDLGTFRQHYRGAFTPQAQQNERDKLDWL